jgi:hypothetical protein
MPLIQTRQYKSDPRTLRSTSLITVVHRNFEETALRVSAYGLSEGRRRSLGMVGQMSAELIGAASELFRMERWYPGSALVRQVVEIEYILYLFASDPEEADRWLSLSPAEAKNYFMPAKMRERSGGKFNADEYSAHCQLGGHPRKNGVAILSDWMIVAGKENDEESIPIAIWMDLYEHTVRSWRHFIAAVRVLSPSNYYVDRINEVETAIEQKYE